jgi:hypothetical protein
LRASFEERLIAVGLNEYLINIDIGVSQLVAYVEDDSYYLGASWPEPVAIPARVSRDAQ